MRHRKGSPEREVHSDKGLPKNDTNISNKQPNPIPTRTQGTTKTTQNKQKEGNNQNQSRVKWHRD